MKLIYFQSIFASRSRFFNTKSAKLASAIESAKSNAEKKKDAISQAAAGPPKSEGRPTNAAPPPPPPPAPSAPKKAELPPLTPLATELHRQGKYIMSCLPKYIQQVSVWKDELTLYVAPDSLLPTMYFLKYHTATQFQQVMDVTAVDFPNRSNRFEVVYHLQSVRYNTRVRVKTYCSEVSTVPSVTSLFPSANWFERETYDMYGVIFAGHPDLRRILTDYGFEGHPLRKDFPLTGYTEVRYDDEKKRVVVEPIELAQALRSFESSSPWDQTGDGLETPKVLDQITHGSEKELGKNEDAKK